LQAATQAVTAAKARLTQTKAGPTEAERREAQAAVAAAQAQLDQLQAGARQGDLAVADAAVGQAEADWKVVADSYDAVTTGLELSKKYGRGGSELTKAEASLRYQLQAATQAVTAAKARLTQTKTGPTEAERREAQAAVAAAQAQYDAAQARLDQIMAGATQEQIAVAEANVAQAQATADLAQANLDKLQLTAPFAGTIGNVNTREGELLAAGQTVLALGDLSSLHVETTDLSEVDVARVAVGQPVNVTFDALKGQTLQGRVTRIAPMSSASQGGVNYTVIVELDQLDPALRWGMTAFTDIQVK
jgi:multidrug resistance efflux pump